MAQKTAPHGDRKQDENESTRERGAEVANVGRRERAVVGQSERRIHASSRPSQEMEHEVAQRGGRTDAHPTAEPPSESRSGDAPASPQTSGYGQREDRENPAAGAMAGQSGEGQSQERRGEGYEPAKQGGRAMSQNGARISDFEDSGRASSIH